MSPASWGPVDFAVGCLIELGNGMERVTYRDSLPMSFGPRYLRRHATR